jgi:hypothetical protein
MRRRLRTALIMRTRLRNVKVVFLTVAFFRQLQA